MKKAVLMFNYILGYAGTFGLAWNLTDWDILEVLLGSAIIYMAGMSALLMFTSAILDTGYRIREARYRKRTAEARRREAARRMRARRNVDVDLLKNGWERPEYYEIVEVK